MAGLFGSSRPYGLFDQYGEDDFARQFAGNQARPYEPSTDVGLGGVVLGMGGRMIQDTAGLKSNPLDDAKGSRVSAPAGDAFHNTVTGLASMPGHIYDSLKRGNDYMMGKYPSQLALDAQYGDSAPTAYRPFDDVLNVATALPAGGLASAAMRDGASAGIFGGKLAKTADALDMSHEARMARAQDVGWRTDAPLYRADRSNITQFDPSKLTDKSGVHFGVDPQQVAPYGGDVREYYTRGPIKDVHLTETGTDYFLKKQQAMQEAKRDGYSGINFTSEQFPAETVIADPRDIRRSDAAFDPARRSSANVLASNPSDSKTVGLFGAMNGATEKPAGGLASAAMRDGSMAAPIRAYRGATTDEFPYNKDIHWSSTNHEVAATYADHEGSPTTTNMTPVDASFTNPLIINNANPTPWGRLKFEGNDHSTTTLATLAKQRGHDGLIVNNVIDPGVDGHKGVGTTIAALRRNTVKSAMTGETLFSNPSDSKAAALAGSGTHDDRKRKPVGLFP